MTSNESTNVSYLLVQISDIDICGFLCALSLIPVFFILGMSSLAFTRVFHCLTHPRLWMNLWLRSCSFHDPSMGVSKSINCRSIASFMNIWIRSFCFLLWSKTTALYTISCIIKRNTKSIKCNCFKQNIYLIKICVNILDIHLLLPWHLYTFIIYIIVFNDYREIFDMMYSNIVIWLYLFCMYVFIVQGVEPVASSFEVNMNIHSFVFLLSTIPYDYFLQLAWMVSSPDICFSRFVIYNISWTLFGFVLSICEWSFLWHVIFFFALYFALCWAEWSLFWRFVLHLHFIFCNMLGTTEWNILQMFIYNAIIFTFFYSSRVLFCSSCCHWLLFRISVNLVKVKSPMAISIPSYNI